MMNEKGQRLIFFWGRECPHCRQLKPIVERYEAESGVTIDRLEVWHDQANQELMRKYGDDIAEACGGELGVPAFYNERTGKAICGARLTFEKIKAWAEG